MSVTPLRLGIIGMGGFAGDHHLAAAALEEKGDCRLVCTCDPNPGAFADKMQELRFHQRGVAVYTDYREMLDAHELDVVSVPTPIPLHAEMHRACVDRGIACYLEKPPTVDYVELDEMLTVEERAQKQTVVGFNFQVEPQRLAVKQRILDGEFGKVKRVSFFGMTGRGMAYYERAPWAGRLMLNDRLVLDSPIGNAMAHHIHNLLFWCGDGGVLEWTEPATVEAELYRAKPIQNYDTCFLRVGCTNGVELRIAASHATPTHNTRIENVVCEEAEVEHTGTTGITIRWRDGRSETTGKLPIDWTEMNFADYFRYVRGEKDRPLTRLIDSRPFVHLNNLAYLSAGRIWAVPEDAIEHAESQTQKGILHAIKDLDEIGKGFIADGALPSQRGLAWAEPGRVARAEDLHSFHQVVREMAAVTG